MHGALNPAAWLHNLTLYMYLHVEDEYTANLSGYDIYGDVLRMFASYRCLLNIIEAAEVVAMAGDGAMLRICAT